VPVTVQDRIAQAADARQEQSARGQLARIRPAEHRHQALHRVIMRQGKRMVMKHENRLGTGGRAAHRLLHVVDVALRHFAVSVEPAAVVRTG
jgi:hypothetical protein